MRERSAVTSGGTLVQIIRVRQYARRGTEADVFDLLASRHRGAWFWRTRVCPGEIIAVGGGTGWGRIRGEDNVLYVAQGCVFEVLPAQLAAAAIRYERRLRAEVGVSGCG